MDIMVRMNGVFANITEARIRRSIRLRPYEAVILDHIKSTDNTHYLYILALYKSDANKPLLWITLELKTVRPTVISRLHAGQSRQEPVNEVTIVPFLCTYERDQQITCERIQGKENLNQFQARAFSILKRKFGIVREDPPYVRNAPRKSNSYSDGRGVHARLYFGLFFTCIGLIILYIVIIVYNPTQPQLYALLAIVSVILIFPTFKVREVFQIKAVEKNEEIERKKQNLLASIKRAGKINLEDAARNLNVDILEIKRIIYRLAGGKKLHGEFSGPDFKNFNEGEIDAFIEELDTIRTKWENSPKKKQVELTRGSQEDEVILEERSAHLLFPPANKAGKEIEESNLSNSKKLREVSDPSVDSDVSQISHAAAFLGDKDLFLGIVELEEKINFHETATLLNTYPGKIRLVIETLLDDKKISGKIVKDTFVPDTEIPYLLSQLKIEFAKWR
ncbi:MAG TPA: hypothetical protein VKK79_09710 [Candidatus Lokiarchaeia archaeon]|nr:hypothetical protein [Candidatus Lokiarchaeia archaeon]